METGRLFVYCDEKNMWNKFSYRILLTKIWYRIMIETR